MKLTLATVAKRAAQMQSPSFSRSSSSVTTMISPRANAARHSVTVSKSFFKTGVFYHIPPPMDMASRIKVNLEANQVTAFRNQRGWAPTLPESRTDIGRIGICPFVGKRTALVRLDRMNPATIVIRQPDAGSVWTVSENQPSTVGRNLSLGIDERCLRHAEKRSYPRNLHI